jgi:hypothetical protein
VWDFNFFARRSEDLLAGEVFGDDAGGGEDGGEEPRLRRVAETVTAASSVLIFFVDGVASALAEARLRVVLVSSAFEVSSFLISTDCGSCFAALFGPPPLAFRVLFLEAGARGSWHCAAEARVAARAIAEPKMVRQQSAVNDKRR